MFDPTAIRLSEEEIARKRAAVASGLIAASENIESPHLEKLSNRDLRLLFDLYDRYFFGGWFYENPNDIPKLSFSARMTRAAGKFAYSGKYPDQCEIRVSVDFLYNLNHSGKEAPVNGLIAKNSLEALQLVFEHELCHLLEYLFFKATGCGKKRFQGIAGQIFGHTSRFHRMPTYAQLAREERGVGVGDRVRFSHEGKAYVGRVEKITKRATVLVENRLLGQAVSYRVPIGMLTGVGGKKA